ncbi:MAG TPA: acyl-CoA dehydrogenase C-terminal domain-containing protein, partial [Pseudonocardiaceae bacterium]|nr:acyl-CoA dehydrogenase C-terminal domain-containing protein [Pseudonocardiaceae bacterium]
AIDLMAAGLPALRAHDHPVARRTATRLDLAVSAARAATKTVLAHDPRDRHAAAVPYLTLLGFLAGGWLHARILTATLDDPDASTERRIREADFYGAHHLSRITSLAEAVEAGEIT